MLCELCKLNVRTIKQPPETLYRVNMSNKRTSKNKYS